MRTAPMAQVCLYVHVSAGSRRKLNCPSFQSHRRNPQKKFVPPLKFRPVSADMVGSKLASGFLQTVRSGVVPVGEKADLKQTAAGGCPFHGQGKSGYPVGSPCVLLREPLPNSQMERIPLLVQEGDRLNRLEWLTEDQARDMLRAGQARFVRRKGSVRALVLQPNARSTVEFRSRNRSARYSHDHEVAETYLDDQGNLRRRHPLDANPRGVWTLKRLDGSLRRIFVTSVTDCMPDRDDAA